MADKELVNLELYFKEALRSAAKNQQTELSPFATQYLSRLLLGFTQSQNYFLNNSSSPTQKLDFPRLALIWLKSIEQNNFDKLISLQKLGDTALFTSGFLSGYIQKTLVDRDYYSAMGSTAYQQVGNFQEKMARDEKNLNVFFELAGNFKKFVSIFEEIAHRSWTQNNSDLLKLYQKWQDRPTEHFYRLLQQAGVDPHQNGES